MCPYFYACFEETDINIHLCSRGRFSLNRGDNRPRVWTACRVFETFIRLKTELLLLKEAGLSWCLVAVDQC